MREAENLTHFFFDWSRGRPAREAARGLNAPAARSLGSDEKRLSRNSFRTSCSRGRDALGSSPLANPHLLFYTL